jgi:hypothetical protein
MHGHQVMRSLERGGWHSRRTDIERGHRAALVDTHRHVKPCMPQRHLGHV